ncbi:MAG: malto-oligosyltrehalose trehalohydrolase [Methylomonas sp.]|jgi:1,4-alpha-glucan branching enzyme/maltooligosyltrehalose trehalohydrolase|uniref:malto-oligosyltrehalose trehalohydrolase n=1 Tax=Methylomonas sp. TaxID=418 RepID=UPI0025DEFE8A|nr:malto-oligosyltrehalose trehalohydrolase [Methylomonas sp.]MCK9608546.1 malto-oligosyltrehalose trehalohydrolase [Methylomonas sp.]
MEKTAINSQITRSHRMPYGAQWQPDGRFCFRIWAPNAKRVELCLRDADAEKRYPLQAEADGWFARAMEAPAGSLYRYRIDGQHNVPDPASRYQPDDVHGYSQAIDPGTWRWTDGDWLGRPWHEAVVYELHVGCFSPAGTFNAVIEKLDYLLEQGITAIQLMPIADFPGGRNWGYDGVLPFAPDSRYGRPEDLKNLVQAAHAKGMMVFLDVVYNHFGPEGNYLHHYARAFFNSKQHTPWGKAFNFAGGHSYWVRRFFIHNALYWLEEYHFDGLRLDAVQAMLDSGPLHVLDELADTLRRQFGQRQIHLILENDDNAAHYLNRDASATPCRYTAQWNDDFHHAWHVLLTGETWGYYQDFADNPRQHLLRCLQQGFAFQGERSAYRQAKPRGEVSAHLPPLAFVNFLQNHDQVGNRPFAERIHQLVAPEAVRAATAVLLLSPFPPMLFMGQEWGCRQPFSFFCDFEAHLSKRVNQARRREFVEFPGFTTAKARAAIPDPSAAESFQRSILDWRALNTAEGQDWLACHRKLLAVRRQEIVPRLPDIRLNDTRIKQLGGQAWQVDWQIGEGRILRLVANPGDQSAELGESVICGRILYATDGELISQPKSGCLPAWAVVCLLA